MTELAEILGEIVWHSGEGALVAPEAYPARFPEQADSLREFFEHFDVSCAGCVAPNQELARQAREVLPLLPEKDRDVIRMVQLEHRSMDEVAGKMGCSRDAADRRLARALHRLRAKSAHGSRDHVR